MPFGVEEGIDSGEDDGDDGSSEQNGREAAQQPDDQNRQTENHPDTAGETMGMIPVILIIERPRELDADGIALAAFGQIIADDDEQDADKEGSSAGGVDGIAQRVGIDHGTGIQADNRTNPEDDIHQLFGNVLLFGVCAHDNGAEKMAGEDEKRQTDDGEQASGISVGRAAEIEVRGNFLGKLIPKSQAEEHRQKDDDRGQDKGTLIDGFHGFLLSAGTARA